MVKLGDLDLSKILSLTHAESALLTNSLEMLGCSKVGWFLFAGLLRASNVLIDVLRGLFLPPKASRMPLTRQLPYEQKYQSSLRTLTNAAEEQNY